MISQNAVTAALREFNGTMLCQDFDNRDATVAMRVALSAALPLLLEGKREEIAREIDPPFWEDLDETVKWLEGQGGKYEAGWPRFRFLKRELAHVMALYDRADRIIAMLGGGE